MASNPQGNLIDGLVGVLEPIERAVADKYLEPLLAELGWVVGANDQLGSTSLLNALAAVPNAVADLRSLLSNPPQDVKGLVSALGKVTKVLDEVLKLKTLFDASAPVELKQIPGDLVRYLAARALLFRHPSLFYFLRVLGIIRDTTVSGLATLDQNGQVQLLRREVQIAEFDFSQLTAILKDPAVALKQEYNLTGGLVDPAGTADKLFPRLRDFFAISGLEASYGIVPTVPADLGDYGSQVIAHSLRAYKVFETSDDSLLRLGAALFLDANLGLMVLPIGSTLITQDIGNWALTLGVSTTGEAFSIKDGSLQLVGGLQEIDVHLAATKKPSKDEAGPAGQPVPPDATVFRIGGQTGTRFELGSFVAKLDASFAASSFDYGVELDAHQGAVVIGRGDTDGFLSSVLPAESKASFDFGAGWSRSRGLHFGGGGSLDIALPVNLTVAGAVTINNVHLTVSIADGVVDLSTRASLTVAIGPVTASVDRIGLGATVTFPDDGGNIGPANADIAFRPPTGLGISVDAGSVTGGGFLFFDPSNSRYGGALELKVYSVNVKAFGVVETKLPSGQSGFSFAIVISAEFNPIQLGLGFTLNGVGGIIGINRRIDQDALAKGVRTGSLEHLLFPHDVVHDAPQIIHDLQAILPPTDGHYIFGPLAKIGWGTPTLIQGELGLILELPGPRLALLGEVSALLPKTDKALVALNLSVAGLLDFPRKYFAIDASLHDSRVGSFPISGDMAMRLSWGDNPTFALAVGGFNPAFQPPPAFPTLRRVSVDLGVSGNPSLTLQGYFAITSNTAQVGALAELHASGSGIDLYGRLQFDALIVFSPFSFEVTLSAQVKISFHGHGISVHLKGVLTGPSPWRIRGEVCVSILWWDACLSFDKSFGSAQTVVLPSLNPWDGSDPTAANPEVLGLHKALEDARNWTPEPPPGSLTVVSLADTSPDSQLIDPLGVAVVKQNVCPFNLQLERFGAAKPSGPAKFFLASAKINGAPIAITADSFRKEPFAKAQFVELKDAQKLSAPSFEPFDGAIRLAANTNSIVSGSSVPTEIKYKTKVIGQPDAPDHTLPLDHLLGMRRRSATGLGGLRRAAALAYLDPTAPPRFTFGLEEFVIGNRFTFRPQAGILTTPANKLQAGQALAAHLQSNPQDGDVLQVYPKFEMAGR